MPRRSRICFPGALYHIFQRGNDKQNVFLDGTDKWHFLKLFLAAKRQLNFLLYCYALMDNHYHITIETPNHTPISKIMQYVIGSYAMYFNKRHGHKGHLFQGRFKDILVEKDSYLLELSRYVHLNPVKAGFVSLPEQYTWSSYGIYVGLRRDILVDTTTLLDCFNIKDKESAQRSYRGFVESSLSASAGEKDWLEEYLAANHFLGTKSFIKKFQKKQGQTPFQ